MNAQSYLAYGIVRGMAHPGQDQVLLRDVELARAGTRGARRGLLRRPRVR
ncbi:MAG: hypothetical protein ACXVW1_05850 [Nocardioides sp.]